LNKFLLGVYLQKVEFRLCYVCCLCFKTPHLFSWLFNYF